MVGGSFPGIRLDLRGAEPCGTGTGMSPRKGAPRANYPRRIAGALERLRRRDASRKVGEVDAEIRSVLFAGEGNVSGHDLLSFKPACFSMLRTVPMGRSRFGWGTVTRPGRSLCLNCQWSP